MLIIPRLKEAEKPSFEEIKRARNLTKRYIKLEAVHINLLIPKEHTSTCDFCGKVHSQQKKYLNKIKNEFHKIKIWQSDKLIEEPIGLGGLRTLAYEIYGDATSDEILKSVIG